MKTLEQRRDEAKEIFARETVPSHMKGPVSSRFFEDVYASGFDFATEIWREETKVLLERLEFVLGLIQSDCPLAAYHNLDEALEAFKAKGML